MGIIYHYCSPEAFISIAKNKKLWLSATNNMNDSAEGVWLIETLKKVLSINVNSINRSSRDYIYNHLFLNNNIKFISCFSKENDLLSQWRAYAQDGEGVAIGFDEDKFELSSGFASNHPDPKESIKINDVLYLNNVELEAAIIQILRKHGIILSDGKDEISSEMLVKLSAELSFLSTIVKNVSFKEEKEKRITYSTLVMGNGEDNSTVILYPFGEMHYRISGSFLTSYFEFGFKNDAIVETIRGPKNKFSQYDIETFMGLNGLGLARAHRSTATYR
ncbi:DUF2971 domain-containing protein [Pectobacterium parmentieri]|uniref:DUF2971 domain-containing protein n=1 Tax=Pectobacterium parmentieri TaxID=1905730 RepID=UPI00067BFB9C|nr:DUF2971 domain-containing protein [Pectobacterium parmentieri]AOR58829.1 hypothetical protein A8F97_07900 [Pectobacterium parmentieri]